MAGLRAYEGNIEVHIYSSSGKAMEDRLEALLQLERAFILRLLAVMDSGMRRNDGK